jgi:hypothetical protein
VSGLSVSLVGEIQNDAAALGVVHRFADTPVRGGNPRNSVMVRKD